MKWVCLVRTAGPPATPRKKSRWLGRGECLYVFFCNLHIRASWSLFGFNMVCDFIHELWFRYRKVSEIHVNPWSMSLSWIPFGLNKPKV